MDVSTVIYFIYIHCEDRVYFTNFGETKKREVDNTNGILLRSLKIERVKFTM